jgi:hypothetical protein
MKLWIRTLEAGFVGALICGLAPSQTLALNGTITFGSGCTTPERTLLTDAMRIMVGQVIGNPKPMQACLKDAILSGSVVSPVEGDVTSPEIIIARLAQDEPTTIECLELGTPGTNDGAQASVGSEFVEVDHDWLSMFGAIDTAALLLHEIGHNKGYVHPGGLGDEHLFAVNNQLDRCSKSISRGAIFNGVPLPNGIPRSFTALGGEIALAQIGAEGGAPKGSSNCSRSRFVVGFHGRAGEFVDALGLTCKPLGNDSSDVKLTATGGGGGTAFQLRCFAGELMVGAWGRVGGFLDAIGPICAREEVVREGNLADFGHDLLQAGPAASSGNVAVPLKWP